MKSILKTTDSHKQDKRVTFGDDIIHTIPNRLNLLISGELKTIRLNRFKLTFLENNYNKIGRFSVKKI